MFDSIEDVLDLVRIPAQEFSDFIIFYFTPAAQVSSLSANSDGRAYENVSLEQRKRVAVDGAWAVADAAES